MKYDAKGFAAAADGSRLFFGVRGPSRAAPGAHESTRAWSGARDEGLALVLLDGIGCDGWAWNHIQPHLSTEHRTVHTHYRGHGRSGPVLDLEHTDVETLADDTLRVMDQAGLADAVLVAHSMGTQVALELYRRAPGRVRALIMICGSYGRITHTFHGNDWLDRALPTLIAQVRKHEGMAKALWGRLPPVLAFKIAGWIGEIDGVALAVDDFRQYVEHLADIDLDLYLTMLQKAGAHSAEDVLASIAVPTLVISAERDTFTPVDVVHELAKRIPDAEYLELAGASHAAPLERAPLINDSIDGFLERIEK